MSSLDVDWKELLGAERGTCLQSAERASRNAWASTADVFFHARHGGHKASLAAAGLRGLVRHYTPLEDELSDLQIYAAAGALAECSVAPAEWGAEVTGQEYLCLLVAELAVETAEDGGTAGRRALHACQRAALCRRSGRPFSMSPLEVLKMADAAAAARRATPNPAAWAEAAGGRDWASASALALEALGCRLSAGEASSGDAPSSRGATWRLGSRPVVRRNVARVLDERSLPGLAALGVAVAPRWPERRAHAGHGPTPLQLLTLDRLRGMRGRPTKYKRDLVSIPARLLRGRHLLYAADRLDKPRAKLRWPLEAHELRREGAGWAVWLRFPQDREGALEEWSCRFFLARAVEEASPGRCPYALACEEVGSGVREDAWGRFLEAFASAPRGCQVTMLLALLHGGDVGEALLRVERSRRGRAAAYDALVRLAAAAPAALSVEVPPRVMVNEAPFLRHLMYPLLETFWTAVPGAPPSARVAVDLSVAMRAALGSELPYVVVLHDGQANDELLLPLVGERPLRRPEADDPEEGAARDRVTTAVRRAALRRGAVNVVLASELSAPNGSFLARSVADASDRTALVVAAKEPPAWLRLCRVVWLPSPWITAATAALLTDVPPEDLELFRAQELAATDAS